MFDLLNMLPKTYHTNAYAEGGWFLSPLSKEGIEAEVCPQSGYLRGMFCPQADTLLLPKAAMNTEACPYHKNDAGDFVLPAAMEWYYKQYHPEYKPVKKAASSGMMDFIYPENGSVINIPRQLDGSAGEIVFNLAHRDNNTTIWWHLDGFYIGQTTDIHQMSLSPAPGPHVLTVEDPSGEVKSLSFTVL